ncbi:MAG TPA: amidohydrolase family protein [Vicinamibacteria bacterium]|nr:amidohydrolase family protein [Vicinamibacteria bacterium]
MELLSAAWIVPGAGPAIRDGLVAVDQGRIAWVGGREDAGRPAGPVRDLGRGVLLPGLVNAHCHLELSHLAAVRGQAHRGYVAWVEALVERRSLADPADARARTEAAIDELKTTGTAAVGDVSNALGHLDQLDASGLAAVVFYELLAWDPARSEAVLEDARRRVAEIAGAGVRTPVRLAAHAPHSVSPPLLRALARGGGPAAIHLAESEAEQRFLSEGDSEWSAFLVRRGVGHVSFAPPRTTPVRYLDGLGALHPGLVAAHCVHVDADERALLARRGVFVVVCPRSNRTIGVGIPPVPEMLAAGVEVCLGTDSLASADSLDLLQDAAALHREFPALEPAAIVRMATATGARALGLGDLGVIARGKRAALAFAPGAATDPLDFLVSGEARARRIEL